MSDKESVEFEYVSGLTLEDAYCRMYKCVVEGVDLFKETYTKRNEGGYAVGGGSVQYHFGEAIDKTTFETLEEAVKYIKEMKLNR